MIEDHLASIGTNGLNAITIQVEHQRIAARAKVAGPFVVPTDIRIDPVLRIIDSIIDRSRIVQEVSVGFT
ncbi:hypothetical protein [Lysobacter gummosus]|uniref:hypothetical protein n=1 Tax=Lysobacter gummosus TaxID=262324 RepID=UPI00363453A7